MENFFLNIIWSSVLFFVTAHFHAFHFDTFQSSKQNANDIAFFEMESIQENICICLLGLICISYQLRSNKTKRLIPNSKSLIYSKLVLSQIELAVCIA